MDALKTMPQLKKIDKSHKHHRRMKTEDRPDYIVPPYAPMIFAHEILDHHSLTDHRALYDDPLRR
jgi:hypothetical protein